MSAINNYSNVVTTLAALEAALAALVQTDAVNQINQLLYPAATLVAKYAAEGV